MPSTDTATNLFLYQTVAKTLARQYAKVGPELEKMPIPEAIASDFGDLVMTIKALCNVHAADVRRERPMIRYDQMDPAHPPKGIKLGICPNCGLVGRIKNGAEEVTYVHTSYRRPGRERMRHRCTMSHDGLKLEVVMPVLPAEPAEENP